MWKSFSQQQVISTRTVPKFLSLSPVERFSACHQSGELFSRFITFYTGHPFINVINVGLGVLMEAFHMHVLLLISFASVWTTVSCVSTYVMLIHAPLIYLVSVSLSKAFECCNLNARHSYFA